MRLVDAAATAAALPFPALVAALRALFTRGCQVPPRQVLSPAPGVTSLVMPAWLEGGPYVVKVVNVAAGNAMRGLPGLHATLLLHDAATGQPLAVIDGDVVTARRTAAASALAADFLARADARRLLVCGAGRVAELLPEAFAAVRRIEQVAVWARRPQAAHALAGRWCARGWDARPAHDLAHAVADADIVSCATLADTPFLRGAWLRPGSHLDLIGSFTPALREADDDCFAGAGVWIDTPEALAKSGDLLGPLARGVLHATAVRGTLAQLCRGEAAGRRDAGERTVFKSVGTALEDLAAAMLVHPAGG